MAAVTSLMMPLSPGGGDPVPDRDHLHDRRDDRRPGGDQQAPDEDGDWPRRPEHDLDGDGGSDERDERADCHQSKRLPGRFTDSLDGKVERPLEDDDTDAEADDSLQPGLSEYRGVDEVEGLRADEDAGDQQERDARDLEPVGDQLCGDAETHDQHDGANK